MSQRTAAGSVFRGCSVLRVVGKVRGEPALGLLERPALPPRVVGDLVLAEAADDEVLRLRVGEVPAADRRARPHRHRLGELDAGVGVDVEELPEGLLLRVLGAGRVAGSGPDADVALADERLVAELL